jgi:hypothetical protein
VDHPDLHHTSMWVFVDVGLKRLVKNTPPAPVRLLLVGKISICSSGRTATCIQNKKIDLTGDQPKGSVLIFSK